MEAFLGREEVLVRCARDDMPQTLDIFTNATGGIATGKQCTTDKK
ncbi:hypothetical protein SAMN02927897_03349 [Kosakonia sacchari]|uniref:Uncharacterized protein n=1 Tax=Kosakonia sacchari TaxID=1158459 RepID=A0A1G4YTC4_9ENTR|nr:hypothetical protein SAMN02927897_03349 [Kosakonia sacchari]